MKKLLLLFMLCQIHHKVKCQDLEPRVYANLPKGTNALGLAYAYSFGNVLTDPSKPISGLKIKGNNFGLAYVRTFGLVNRLARVQVSIPLMFITGRAQLNGRDTSAVRNGFGDARIRFGINLIGSPALSLKEFRLYQQKTIVGFSLVTSVPVGIYHKTKLINLGSNRWAF